MCRSLAFNLTLFRDFYPQSQKTIKLKPQILSEIILSKPIIRSEFEIGESRDVLNLDTFSAFYLGAVKTVKLVQITDRTLYLIYTTIVRKIVGLLQRSYHFQTFNAC